MLFHIVPRIYLPQEDQAHLCEFQGLQVPEMGLNLRAGKEVVERKPYPNKRYSVVCRKVGQKAWDGILLETSKAIMAFTSISSWMHHGTGKIIEHKVHYSLADDEFPAATSSMVRWHAFPELGWQDRWPDWAKECTPALAQPRMELFATARHGEFADFVESGMIVCREEFFVMPSVPRDRVVGDDSIKLSLVNRTPSIDHAFKVG